MQLSAMRDYGKNRRCDALVEVQDVASGATARLQREKLIEAALQQEIDLVLVWRLDRSSRALVGLVKTLEELNTLDVGFVSLCEALDLTTRSGRALAGMLAVFAEFKRDILWDLGGRPDLEAYRRSVTLDYKMRQVWVFSIPPPAGWLNPQLHTKLDPEFVPERRAYVVASWGA